MDKCISKTLVLDASEAPSEVMKEVREVWAKYELGNGDYTGWDTDDEDLEEDFPIITRYLRGQGVKTCLVHWWW